MSVFRSRWSSTVLGAVAMLIAYYAFPVEWGDSPGLIVLSLVLTAVGLCLLGWVMIEELGHLRRGETMRSSEALALLLVLLVMAFSLAFFLVNLARPDEIYDLHTRTDALYFTLSTMATVGYGDVHAEGQVARGMVCALIVFDVAVLAALLRGYTSRPLR